MDWMRYVFTSHLHASFRRWGELGVYQVAHRSKVISKAIHDSNTFRFLCQGLDLPSRAFCPHFKNGISRDMIAVETPDAYRGSRVRISNSSLKHLTS